MAGWEKPERAGGTKDKASLLHARLTPVQLQSREEELGAEDAEVGGQPGINQRGHLGETQGALYLFEGFINR